MNLGIIGSASKKIGSFMVKNGPTILTGSAVVGTVLTGVFAGKAAIKARDVIKAHEMDEELKCEKIEQVEGVVTDHIVYFRERTFFEKAKLTWKCYLPPVVMGAATISCICGANTVHTRRNIALATAYNISEEAAREFKDKVRETIGEKKLDKINNEIAQDHINKSTFDEKTVTLTGDGDQLFYDWWSQRYFKSSRTMIEKRVLTLKKRMLTHRKAITMNDFYKELGLTSLPIGDDFGFKYSYELDEDELDVTFYPIFGPDQEPCTEIMVNPELLNVI